MKEGHLIEGFIHLERMLRTSLILASRRLFQETEKICKNIETELWKLHTTHLRHLPAKRCHILLPKDVSLDFLYPLRSQNSRSGGGLACFLFARSWLLKFKSSMRCCKDRKNSSNSSLRTLRFSAWWVHKFRMSAKKNVSLELLLADDPNRQLIFPSESQCSVPKWRLPCIASPCVKPTLGWVLSLLSFSTGWVTFTTSVASHQSILLHSWLYL